MGETPVPIPNTTVKTQAADGWESVTPEVSDLTAKKELPKAGRMTGVKS